ncbi:hypothetical protein BDF20DRAFT_865612 [Mycotypha africana]|uniref:uncharacterized protein n=1 Tax=Mycotypha africana TaxID=64632 RepID=UPI002301D7F0|nr:uncharacterized protein BDF20DRAFT_865612 [Mycotypha africana]KAI8982206.1 hypothetical protein BDF20DRAFT_865612 [Mycotypha africana]
MSFAKIRHETREMVKTHMAAFDSSHDIYHIDRVVNLAIVIANDLIETGNRDVDLEVVILAALCHDIGDHKYAKNDEKGLQHGIVTAFLERLGYPKASLVGKIVDHVGFSKELGWNDALDDPKIVQWRNNCLELHSVQDADKLDALGAFGILRCAAFSGARNRPLYIPAIDGHYQHSSEGATKKDLTRDEYLAEQSNKQSSAIAHFHDKLFKLKSMIRTAKGSELAIERHNFMLTFVQQIEKEIELNN